MVLSVLLFLSLIFDIYLHNNIYCRREYIINTVEQVMRHNLRTIYSKHIFLFFHLTKIMSDAY
jgi:hypothetical protein